MDHSAIKAVPLPALNQKRAGNQALMAIAVYKMVKAVICMAAAIGVFSVLHQDTQMEMRKLLHVFRISGDRQFAKEVLRKSNLIDVPKKKLITALLAFSAVMFTIEGTGLLLRKPWAEFFTAALTSVGIPIELYEIWRHATVLKYAALIINVAIVWFLIVILVRGWKERQKMHSVSHLEPERLGAG